MKTKLQRIFSIICIVTMLMGEMPVNVIAESMNDPQMPVETVQTLESSDLTEEGVISDASYSDVDKEKETVPIEEQGEEQAEEPASEKQSEPSALAAAVVELAKKQVGKPFASGATGPASFDNSGLIYYCFNENDVEIPRLTSEFIAAGTQVTREELLPGDIAENAVFHQFGGGGKALVTVGFPDGDI